MNNFILKRVVLLASNVSDGETDLFEDPNQMIHCFESFDSPAAQNCVNREQQKLTCVNFTKQL